MDVDRKKNCKCGHPSKYAHCTVADLFSGVSNINERI